MVARICTTCIIVQIRRIMYEFLVVEIDVYLQRICNLLLVFWIHLQYLRSWYFSGGYFSGGYFSGGYFSVYCLMKCWPLKYSPMKWNPFELQEIDLLNSLRALIVLWYTWNIHFDINSTKVSIPPLKPKVFRCNEVSLPEGLHTPLI